MKIRKIDNKDIGQIEHLWNDLKKHHQQRTTDHAQYYLERNFSQRKSELLAKDLLAIFIAESEGQIVGYCVVSVNEEEGEIDSLFVAPGNRQEGVGQLLTQAGVEWLRNHKLVSIKLSVGQGNERAISFYEKLGFSKRATLMELKMMD